MSLQNKYADGASVSKALIKFDQSDGKKYLSLLLISTMLQTGLFGRVH